MKENIARDRILVIDFGSQYTQLIARRIRELGVYSEIRANDITLADLQRNPPCGIILSGGPETVTADDAPTIPAAIFEIGCPVLGICYGMQAMAAHFGGAVSNADKREFGPADLTVLRPCSPLLQAICRELSADNPMWSIWMSHGDQVSQLPADFECLAQTPTAPYAAIAHRTKPWYGVQFHPEVTHTTHGGTLLKSFVLDICGCQTLWSTTEIIKAQIAAIREQVGDNQVLLGLSGGVDSAVVAALLHEAIGDQLIAIFVDNGLLRLSEGDDVMRVFAEHFHIRVERVNAGETFLSALQGVTDPEQKRKIIGKLFIDVFEQQLARFPQAKFLAQGTIYPDVVESAKTKHGKAHVIKSHHNVGGLPEHMQLDLVEPLRELFKDEVRALGLQLGLPASLIHRHPFPGPGLGVRILGEVTFAKAECLRAVDAIFIEELRRHDLYERVSQAFAVLLPVNSVGVVGDARHYAPVVALRAVETIDFMTARWAYLPHDFLAHVSSRIVNEVADVSRVVYDISGKPPATIEWE